MVDCLILIRIGIDCSIGIRFLSLAMPLPIPLHGWDAREHTHNVTKKRGPGLATLNNESARDALCGVLTCVLGFIRFQWAVVSGMTACSDINLTQNPCP